MESKTICRVGNKVTFISADNSAKIEAQETSFVVQSGDLFHAWVTLVSLSVTSMELEEDGLCEEWQGGAVLPPTVTLLDLKSDDFDFAKVLELYMANTKNEWVDIRD